MINKKGGIQFCILFNRTNYPIENFHTDLEVLAFYSASTFSTNTFHPFAFLTNVFNESQDSVYFAVLFSLFLSDCLLFGQTQVNFYVDL